MRPRKFTRGNDFIGLAALLRNFFGLQLWSPWVCPKRPRPSERQRSDPRVVGALRRLDRRGCFAPRDDDSIQTQQRALVSFRFGLDEAQKAGKTKQIFRQAKRNVSQRRS